MLNETGALIPAFNEYTDAAVGALSVCQQVLVVDDGSADDTAILAQSAGAHQPARQPGERGGYQGRPTSLDRDVVLLVDGDGRSGQIGAAGRRGQK